MNDETQKMIDHILDLDLPTEDYAIFGSGPMMIHGLKEFVHDLDVITRGAAWEKVKNLGPIETAPLGDQFVKIYNGRIEIYNGWKPGDMDAEKLIDEAEVIDGLPWVHIEHVLEYKKALNRDKDQPDIEKLEHYLATHHRE